MQQTKMNGEQRPTVQNASGVTGLCNAACKHNMFELQFANRQKAASVVVQQAYLHPAAITRYSKPVGRPYCTGGNSRI